MEIISSNRFSSKKNAADPPGLLRGKIITNSWTHRTGYPALFHPFGPSFKAWVFVNPSFEYLSARPAALPSAGQAQ